MHTLHAVATALVLAIAAAATAHAQQYPVKPIRMIIPYPPGGGTDLLGRPMAKILGDKWGQNIIIDNRGGASGMVGAEIAARSPADGYTILMSASGEVSLNVALYPKMSYDPVRDFVPVTQLAVSPLVLVLHPSLPAKTLKEFIALAKKRPGEITYSSVGAGSPQNMAGEWLNLLAGIRLVHVAYKGGGPQLTDMLGGHTASAFFALPVAAPHLKSGRLRPVGMTSEKRSSAFPEVPTFSESGLPGFDVTQWWAIWAPRGTPPEIVARLHAEFSAMTKLPEIRERMASLGAEPVGGTPEQLGSLVRSEIAKYQKIVRDANIKLE
jgi:tripartite-type tricarboxylate transporter receptor subunit TctC